jgi:pyruvate/2-oxoglutarate dehydrogenase complex dihydrolipoamide acyltransferase (E2) component
MLSKNVELHPAIRMTPWRKISVGSWKPVGDSQVYCELDLDAEPALKWLESVNQSQTTKITITHLAGKVLGRVLKEVPDLNSIVRFNKIYPRKNVDIFFHVVQPDKELSGHVVRSCDTKSLTVLAHELNETSQIIKRFEDKSFKKIKNNWKRIPSLLSKHVLDLVGLIFYSFNVFIPGAGIPKDAFGSMMLTNIGSLGFERAFVPLPPYSKVPFVVALGRIVDRVCVVEGKAGVKKRISFCCTFDHRIIDGAHGAEMAKKIEYYFTHPEEVN